MEKFIIIGSKDRMKRIDPFIRMVISPLKEILIIDSKEKHNYEEMIEEFNDNIVCVLHDSQPENLRKEIEETEKLFKLKSQEILGVNPMIDKTPRYDRFIKKWKRKNNWPKYQVKKK